MAAGRQGVCGLGKVNPARGDRNVPLALDFGAGPWRRSYRMDSGKKGARRRQHAITLNVAPRWLRSEGGGMTLPTPYSSRRNTAAIFRGRAASLFVVLLSLTAAPTQACPVCDSETGQDVRRGLFNEDFGKNLLITVLPFPIFCGIVALIYYGPPRRERTKE